MTESIRLDSVDTALTTDSVRAFLSEKNKQVEELSGRLDAMGLELEKERAERAKLEDPKAINSKVQSRIKLLEKCREILGSEFVSESQSDDELKLLVIQKFYPDLELSDKSQDYLDGVFEAICSMKATRNDSLMSTRQAIESHQQLPKSNQAYEKWLEYSANMWTLPLTGKIKESF